MSFPLAKNLAFILLFLVSASGALAQSAGGGGSAGLTEDQLRMVDDQGGNEYPIEGKLRASTTQRAA